MKVISLGLQCSVPEGIKRAGLRICAYPFDWLWSPSKTTYTILEILLNEGCEKAAAYMTEGFTYYKYLGNEHYISVEGITESQMNKDTGLGITHNTINNTYKDTLIRRLARLLEHIYSGEQILFVYADAACPSLNYHLDNVEYGLGATNDLIKIYNLLKPINNNINILYFCWRERFKHSSVIEHIPFSYKQNWIEVSNVISYFLTHKIRSFHLKDM